MGKKIESKNKHTDVLGFIGVSVFFFIIYLLLNIKSGYINDDYTYRLVFEYWRVSDNPVKVSSLHDIYVSMVNHYLLWGGRVPVHTTIQLLLWLVDKNVFNIINSLMAILLGNLVYFHANFGKKNSLFLYVISLTMIWFFMPQPELTMLDLTNSVNNMWVCVYILIFLIPYRILLKNEIPSKHRIGSAALMVPLGFLAGWSNEPGGAAAGAMAVLVVACLIKNKKKPPLWAYTGIVSLATGWIIMTFAPGYRVKAEKYYGIPSVFKNAVEHFGSIQKTLFSAAFKTLWPMLLLILVSTAVLYGVRGKQFTKSNRRKQVVSKKTVLDFVCLPETLYVFCAFVSVFIYVIAPDFQPRYLFPAAIFLIIAAGIMISRVLHETDLKEKSRRVVAAVLICACVVLVAADAIYEYNIVSYNYELTSALEKDIETQIEQGQKKVVIKGNYHFLSAGRYSLYKNMYKFGIDPEMIWGGFNPEDEMNRLFAAYFGAETYVNEANMDYVRSK